MRAKHKCTGGTHAFANMSVSPCLVHKHECLWKRGRDDTKTGVASVYLETASRRVAT